MPDPVSNPVAVPAAASAPVAPEKPSGFWRKGEPFVWLSGAALTLSLLFTLTLFAVVLWNGLGVFWPAPIAEVELRDAAGQTGGKKLIGIITQQRIRPATGKQETQLRVANRELNGQVDFVWKDAAQLGAVSWPADLVAVERSENGLFLGRLEGVQTPALKPAAAGDSWGAFLAAWTAGQTELAKVKRLEQRISQVNREAETVRLRLLKLRYYKVPEADGRVRDLLARQEGFAADFRQLTDQLSTQTRELKRNVAQFRIADGRVISLPLAAIVTFYRPNQMGVWAKLRHYAWKVRELLFDDPRESNTEGGLFPCIFGTVMLIFLMSVTSFPFGVMAGVYLREYAREGALVRLVRIAVNNLAGIPSIVYGIFGLGFFVYFVGGSLDAWLFPERLPTPTFGTGGILWASLTLGLLTVPVVIVATEEALGAIPRGIREGSLALGATKFQTLTRVLIPMASPGIMTGFILAMARAAGEVAPLMITGVVKLAPALPLDGQWPFFHLDYKFMHLAFHIYDIGFQSPNVEAAKPMVYVTTMLLVAIVILMSSSAIYLRNTMKRKYTVKSI